MSTYDQPVSVLAPFFSSGGLATLFQDSGDWKFSWKRLLSWADSDQHFNDFLNFLEISARTLPEPLDSWCMKLNKFLDYPRNRVLFFILCSGCWRSAMPHMDEGILRLLESRHRAAFELWLQQERVDRLTTGMVVSWHESEEVSTLLRYQGVSLGCGLEYELCSSIISSRLLEQSV